MSDRKPFDVVGQLSSLRRYAWSLTRNETQAEDLVHDALLRAYEVRHTFRPEGNLRAWLLSILHNTFVNDARRRRAEVIRLQRAAELAETQAGPAQESAVQLAQIRKAFIALPEEQRAALHLVAIEGLPYRDAAATLGIPVGTLMSRLGRAREALRRFEGERRQAVRSASDTHRYLRVVGGSDDEA